MKKQILTKSRPKEESNHQNQIYIYFNKDCMKHQRSHTIEQNYTENTKWHLDNNPTSLTNLSAYDRQYIHGSKCWFFNKTWKDWNWFGSSTTKHIFNQILIKKLTRALRNPCPNLYRILGNPSRMNFIWPTHTAALCQD